MAPLASRSGVLTALLQWTSWHANAQRVRSEHVASTFATPASLDAAAQGSWVSSFEDKVTAARTRAVVVRYDATVIDSHAKTAEKARELEVMPGVQNASALTCVGVVVVSCHSDEMQRQFLDDLTVDPHVKFAQHTDSGMGNCNMPETQFPTNLRMVSAQATTDNLTQLSIGPAEFVGGHFTVSGLDLEVARGMPQAWQRLLAVSLSNTTEGEIEITRIVPFPNQHHIREKQGVLRSRSAKVEFRVLAAAGGGPAFLDRVEARLKLLHRSGRATERFDVALDSELADREVVLPDWARSRFSRPYRGSGGGTNGNPNEASEGDSVVILTAFIVMFVGFVIMFLNLGSALGISTMPGHFTSPIGDWDGYP